MKLKDKKAHQKYEETEEEIKASHLVQYDSHRESHRRPNVSHANLVEYSRND
jgi:hypothetical protein